MRTKSIILLLLALGCGVVASVGVKQVLATRESTVARPFGDMQAIIVAAEDIPMGDPVKIEQIKLEDWPKSKVPEGALTKLDDVEGRRPKTKIYKGAPILEDQLLAKGAVDAGAAPWIPKGYRVVSVRVDAVSGSAAMLRPSDRVDVVVHFPANPRKGIPRDYTRTILQNVKVFAVDDKYILAEDEQTQKSLPAKTISLLVTPEQAEILTAASELGQIRLVMRGLGDNEPALTKGIDPAELLGLPTPSGDPEKEIVPGSQPDVLAEFLNTGPQSPDRPQPGVVPVASTPRESWGMRLLVGSRVEDLTLERLSNAETEVGGSWRVIEVIEKGASADEKKAESTPDSTGPTFRATSPDEVPPEAKPEPLAGDLSASLVPSLDSEPIPERGNDQ